MNYRHAFHAGNFADVFKHAAFALIIEYLKRKPAPFAVVDTHAGLGRYDLAAVEAEKTGEWRQGIGRVLDLPQRPPGLAPLLKVLAAANDGETSSPRWYPGSPRIARTLLRKRDRLWCAELHPEDARVLMREFRGDGQVVARQMDGYEALRAWLPPPERRGVVLVDPPFEQRDEFKFLLKGLKDGYRRFETGVFVLWYPIKDRAPTEAFHQALGNSGIRRILAAELLLRPPTDPTRLNGCGLIVVNPPWRLDRDLAELEAGLRVVFNESGGNASQTRKTKAVHWLVGE